MPMKLWLSALRACTHFKNVSRYEVKETNSTLYTYNKYPNRVKKCKFFENCEIQIKCIQLVPLID